jgi:hypothetical protein
MFGWQNHAMLMSFGVSPRSPGRDQHRSSKSSMTTFSMRKLVRAGILTQSLHDAVAALIDRLVGWMQERNAQPVPVLCRARVVDPRGRRVRQISDFSSDLRVPAPKPPVSGPAIPMAGITGGRRGR